MTNKELQSEVRKLKKENKQLQRELIIAEAEIEEQEDLHDIQADIIKGLKERNASLLLRLELSNEQSDKLAQDSLEAIIKITKQL